MSSAPPADLAARIQAATDYIIATGATSPTVGVVLGSGLGALAESLADARVIAYSDVPHWPVSTVEGHAGRLVLGTLAGAHVAIMQGRAHLYEGYAPWQVVFPTRVLARLGCRNLLLTNAAGAVNESFEPGDLMLITDHLNLQGVNPCSGANLDGFGERFFDMTHAYAPDLASSARMAALERQLTLREGVYAGLLGPSFETPAEIRMLRTLGADAVGMSTVLECIAANHAGVRVGGLSCITNMAAGILDQPLNHEEVIEIGASVRDDVIGLMTSWVRNLADGEAGDD